MFKNMSPVDRKIRSFVVAPVLAIVGLLFGLRTRPLPTRPTTP